MKLKMSLAELRDMAKEGKTAEHNVGICDWFKVNDKNDAYIVKIGNDYITCMCFAFACAFNNEPKVNKKDKFAIISYPDSYLHDKVNEWFNNQSDMFKSVIKTTNKCYEAHSLSYIDNEYHQTFYKHFNAAEKVFIPTLDETNSLAKLPLPRLDIWCSTPKAPNKFTPDEGSFGYFYCDDTPLYPDSGNFEHFAGVLFNIG